MFFATNLRTYFRTVVLLKFQGDLVNAETLSSGQKSHLMISLRVLYALRLQSMLIGELTLFLLQLARLMYYGFENFPISCTYVQTLLCTYLTEVPGLQHEQN